MSQGILEISNILNQLLELAHLSEAELARRIKIPRATINRLTTGRTPDPRASTLNAIAEFFEVTVDQLLGKRPLYVESQSNRLVTKSISVPVIGWNDCQNWKSVIAKLGLDLYQRWIMIDHVLDEAKFAIKVDGEAMWPQFQTDTLLVVAPYREAKNRDFVIAHIKERDEIVFRQLIVENKYKFLTAINNIFPTINIGDQDEIIGVVVQTRSSY